MDLSSITKIQCKQYTLGCYIYVYYFLLVLFFHFCSTPVLLRHAEEDSFCSCQPESVFAVRGPCWGNLFLLSFFSPQGSRHKDCPLVCSADSHAFSAALCSSCCSSAWLREHKLKYKGLLWPLLADTAMANQTFYIIFTWLSSFFPREFPLHLYQSLSFTAGLNRCSSPVTPDVLCTWVTEQFLEKRIINVGLRSSNLFPFL